MGSKNQLWAATLFAALALVAPACSSTKSFSHRVRAGENLYRISKAYGVPVGELAKLNGIRDPARIEVGQELRVPGAKRQLPVNLITPKNVSTKAPRAAELPAGSVKFAWPLDAPTLSSSFGQRGDSFHDGIDLSAPVGTPVKAVEAGEVIYSDVLRGYGNVIIVRHANGYASVYAHNDRNLVHNGQQVRQGDVIATVGDSGRTTGANLHFEVRKDNVARDPLLFLPANQMAGPRRWRDVGG